MKFTTMSAGDIPAADGPRERLDKRLARECKCDPASVAKSGGDVGSRRVRWASMDAVGVAALERARLSPADALVMVFRRPATLPAFLLMIAAVVLLERVADRAGGAGIRVAQGDGRGHVARVGGRFGESTADTLQRYTGAGKNLGNLSKSPLREKG